MNRRLLDCGLPLIALAALLGGAITVARATDADPQDESFKKYGQVFKGKIGRTYAESEEWYPEATKPKPGTPNVLIILLDDVGFAQYGSFVGPVETSHIHVL